MNDIIKLLDLKDDSITVDDIKTVNDTMIICISKKYAPMYCPLCNSRMQSKGIYTRKVNYPVLQNGYKVVIHLKQRKWHCTDPLCNHYCNDEFVFAQRYSHNANMVPYMILNVLKDLNVSAAQAARTFNVSDTYVHNIVLRYLDPQRLPFPPILSIDEVYLDFDKGNKYALVLMDFLSGEIIDILPNRLDKTASDYFLSIDKKERSIVKYIVCDMYNEYVNYPIKFFPNAKTIIDSFHVIQWIINKINNYINDVKKKYQKRDQKLLEKENYENNRDNKKKKDSREVFILKNFKWVLLKNKNHIDYSLHKHKYWHLNMRLNTYDIEKMFLDLDPMFRKIRDLKEEYIYFNDDFPKNIDDARIELEIIIDKYKKCEINIFIEFADLLERYKEEILLSFTELPHKKDEDGRRISNGPIEGFNRKPKDFKRNSRGVDNYAYTKNRLLWATRQNEPVLAVPKSEQEIHNYTGIKRGIYNKKI